MAALFSVLLASCTSAGDPTLSVGMPGYNATSADVSTASGANQVAAVDSSSQVTTSQMTTTAEGDAALPEQVAYVPVARPGAKPDAGFPVAIPADAETIAGHTPQPLEQSGQTAEQAGAAVQKTQTADAATPKPEGAAPVMNNPVYVTAGEPPQAPKKSLLASFFSATPASAAPAPAMVNTRSGERAAVTQVATAQPKATTPTPAKAAVTLASATAAEKPVQLASTDTSNYTSDALPGVRQTALFEIKRKSGLDDESDVDLNEDEGSGGSYQVASAAGLARLAPNGLLKQTESVDIACLKPSLVRVLKTIEGHYGRKMVVTSGYRDPARNRRANGAKNSLHMYCAAADIQVPGVSKWELASYIRTMAGRGGVGTYCHTESVHVDVGPERDWNWRCRRRG